MGDNQDVGEAFDMGNDYEGGMFIGGEYFHKGKVWAVYFIFRLLHLGCIHHHRVKFCCILQKERRNQTKEDAIYGMFWSDSDDEGRGRKKRKGKKESQPVDYTRPMGFVKSSAGGTVEDEQKHEREEKEKEMMETGLLKMQEDLADNLSDKEPTSADSVTNVNLSPEEQYLKLV